MEKFKFIKINVSSRVPKYKQIVDLIKQGISDGHLLMGDQIPSINALSEGFDISRDTVDKAYRLLKEQNVHCEDSLFIDILKNRDNQYSYYVVMPHFRNESLQHMGCTDEILKALHAIPKDKLIIMDRNLDSFSEDVGRSNIPLSERDIDRI